MNFWACLGLSPRWRVAMYWPASLIPIITIRAEPAFDLNQTPAFFLKVRLQNLLVTRGPKFFFRACRERPLRKDSHIEESWGGCSVPGGHPYFFGPEEYRQGRKAWRSPPPGAATPGSSWKNCGAAALSSSTRTPRTSCGRASSSGPTSATFFLNAHIRGQSLYAGLLPMVDQRLQFLREQMHLGRGFNITPRRNGPPEEGRPG